jgi:hypothetical protein
MALFSIKMDICFGNYSQSEGKILKEALFFALSKTWVPHT